MKVAIVAALALLVACESYSERSKRLVYFSDERTGVCFAGLGWGTEYAVMTAVPCTPEVKALIDGGRP